MLKIINNQSKNSADTFKKWSPILEKLNFQTEHLEVFSQYCENHSNIENHNNQEVNVYGTLTTAASTLPASLKLLSLLNLKGKNIQLTDSPRFEYEQDSKILFGDIGSMFVDCYVPNEFGIFNETEALVKGSTQQLAENINTMLIDHQTIVLYQMVSATENNLKTKLFLTSRFHVADKYITGVKKLYTLECECDVLSNIQMVTGDSVSIDKHGKKYITEKGFVSEVFYQEDLENLKKQALSNVSLINAILN